MPCNYPHRCPCIADLPDLYARHRYECSREGPLDGGFENLYLEIVCTLACILTNHPDPGLRQKARIELLHPVYNEARRRYGENLDQPDRRARGC